MNTAQDIVHYILAATGGGAQDGEHSSVRQAVVHGVREVLQCRQWLWHTRNGYFTTRQIATTASVVSGSREVTVASTAGFVPGRIADASAECFPVTPKIVSVSGNVVTMDVAANKTQSGVTIKPQTFYDLPADVKDIDALVTNTVGTLHCYITPQEWQRLEINTRGAGEPYYYTIMRSDVNPTRYQVRFVGVPAEETVVNYTYRYMPKQIKYMGYEALCRQGTVKLEIANQRFVVTGTGTAFPQDCVGSAIRFGTTSTDPDPVGSLMPFVAERRIQAWSSPTSIIIAGAEEAGGYPLQQADQAVEFDGGIVLAPQPTPPANTASNIANSDFLTLPPLTRYALTDVIDASPQMYTAILSACELWYARIAGKPAGDAFSVFNRDLRLAMESDVVSPISGRQAGMYPTPRSAGWHSSLLPDVV